MQPDQATDDVELASVVGFDHAAKRAAGVHNWSGWVIPVGIEQHDTNRGTRPPHPVASGSPC